MITEGQFAIIIMRFIGGVLTFIGISFVLKICSEIVKEIKELKKQIWKQ